jgi:aspartate ammonia-lyase
MSFFRDETDVLGSVKVPEDALYGIFTVRARNNFKISELRIDEEFVRTLAEVKKASANAKLGLLDKEFCEAINRAAMEVIEGIHEGEFALNVFQAGAGTPWNMNMNEVLANRANQILGSALGKYVPIHPNDHVNISQSSNDVIPNTIRITTLKLYRGLIQTLMALEEALIDKADEFSKVRKSGRTHTRDAVPINLSQEIRAYFSAIKTARRRVESSMVCLRSIFLGGTAVGTGLNTHPNYARLVLEALKEITRLELNLADNKIEKTQFVTDFLAYIDSLASLSVDLVKICNDLMLLSSGPLTGLNELVLPSVEPGSSIMPGKVNPSILECVNMVCFQVMGSRTVVENASKFGVLDLNVYTPVIAFNIFNFVKWLTNAIKTLTEMCITGLEFNRKSTNYYFNYPNAVATLLNLVIGYKEAAILAVEALERGIPIKDLVVERGFLTVDQMDKLIMHSCEPNLHIVKKILEERKE